ncbi:MAG: lantibiotic dehydratase [Actinomycetota bacterium]|uniref:Lantibiotic dehydratase n=1 Tax=Mycobacterium lentiflavum TaxID=141349 RepID=A0ABY3UYE4_MYCLN|nr:lantibiotic dehydratase [Mycobacterium lentiflavum]MEE3063022.1 lantibiotic dehydratase [Actinomycetota bacterium]ULP44591.1 lantibiotic dehydratase [Mycobacterium lentiflavum]
MTDHPRQNPPSYMRSLSDSVIIRCSLGTVAEYPDDPGEWGDRDAIARLWSGDIIREAVLLASPVLAAEVDKLLSSPGTGTPEKKRKRLHKSLLKYALRLSTRCTPFGMFAGVAVLPVGDGEPMLGKSHIRHVRAAGAVTRRLVEEMRAMPQARLHPNPALIERADRLVVTVMRGIDETHTLASIRATGPARLAIDAATGTAARLDIERRVAVAYPAAGSLKVQKLVDDLLQAEVLLCEAEHSAFDADPLARVPGAAEMRAALARYAEASDPVGDGSLDSLLQLCSAEDTQRDVHVDVELDASGKVSESVVDAACDAMTSLAATMAHLPATPALDEFSAAFLERYGNTRVPFLTAVDEELGIGYPRTYETVAPPARAADDDPAADRRRDLIARLLRRAASGVVELTDTDLASFPAPEGMPGSFDLILGLHREPAGLRATINGIGFPGGSAAGRFTAVIPRVREHAQRCVDVDTAWWSNNTGGRGILCGVDYIAGTDSINEVAATAPLYSVTLAVNARPHLPSGPVLTLADVYLGHADGRVRTVLADGTPASVRQLNMATTRASAKAIRLLREISDAGIRLPFWSWGEAEAILNHLPAVRYRGVTLAEERWRYPEAADRTQVALRDWLADTGVSRYIRIGPHDNQLHLDTKHPAHLELLLDEISAGNRWLFRAPGPDQMGVVRDDRAAAHPAEVVVTVVAPGTSRVEPDLTNYPLHDPADDEHRLLAPGGEWTAFTISAARGSHDRTLLAFADAFPELAGAWYFVRYRENDRDQLRMRVQRPIVELSDVLAWMAEARLAGRIGDYTIPVYHRELERYGGTRSFPCYERLFCLETAQIVAMLPIVDPNSPTPAISAPLIRPGVEAAAGVLTQWLDGLDPSRAHAGEVIDVAVENYSRELGTAVHKIKTGLRKQHPRIKADNDLGAVLRAFWADPAQRDAVMTPDVLQSASHLLCVRLGLQRHEEFAAIWMVKTERNRRERSTTQP